MTGQQGTQAFAHAPATALSITRGNPTAEEVAALTAVVSALAAQDQDTAATAPTGTELRRGKLRRRRALSASPLPWKVGRH